MQAKEKSVPGIRPLDSVEWGQLFGTPQVYEVLDAIRDDKPRAVAIQWSNGTSSVISFQKNWHGDTGYLEGAYSLKSRVDLTQLHTEGELKVHRVDFNEPFHPDLLKDLVLLPFKAEPIDAATTGVRDVPRIPQSATAAEVRIGTTQQTY